MSVAWTIAVVGGSTKPLRHWGISGAKLTRRNLDTDELTFVIIRLDLYDDPAFTYGQTLALKADGVTRFRGVVTKVTAIGNARTQADEYVVSGPWWQLSNLIYQQPRQIKNTDFSDVDSEDTTRVVLGQDELGLRITTGEQIAQILAYALTQSVPLVAGTMPAFITVPLDECRDITCAEAIRRQLSLTPDVVGWFDYSTSVPSFNVQKRELLAAVAIDLADVDRVEALSPAARNDLVPPGVVFIYITTADNEFETWTRVTRDTAGATSGVGVITATIEMMGAGTAQQEAPPTGLAALYWSALQTLQWEGSLQLHEADCTGDLSPGKVVNLASGRTAWATMRAVVQIVTEDLQRGITSIDYGPPEHLAPQDFVNFLMFNRKVARPPDPTNIATVKPPLTPTSTTNTNAGKHTITYSNVATNQLGGIQLKYCDGGVEHTVTVAAPTSSL